MIADSPIAVDVALIVLRWIAGGLLVVSGSLKWGRAAELQASLVPMGFPEAVANLALMRRVAVPLFPMAEIALGVTVIGVPGPVGTLATSAAVALYAFFVVLTARVVFSGRQANCECFGAVLGGEVSGRTLMRNVCFLAVAVAALFAPDPALPISAGVALAALLSAIVVIVVRAAHARDKRARALGSLALQSLSGAQVPLGAVDATTFVFLSASCSSCQTLAGRLTGSADLPPTAGVVLMGQPAEFEYFGAFASLLDSGSDRVWFDVDRSVARAMGRLGTPGLVQVDRAHPLGTGWTTGAAQIEKTLWSAD